MNAGTFFDDDDCRLFLATLGEMTQQRFEALEKNDFDRVKR